MVVGVGLAASSGWGDVMVVAGHQVESPREFMVVGDEIYAPLLPALKYLGAEFEVTPDVIQITTANGREVVIFRNLAEATRDGVVRELPGPPRRKEGVMLLPARAVGSLLGCAVRWKQETRTLFLHPWVRTFSLDRLRDRYRLTVGAEGPMGYRVRELEAPPRLALDLLNVDLAQIPSSASGGVEEGYLKGARIQQHSLAPSEEGEVVRVVVELAERRPYRVRESEDKCRLEVDFPLPEATELPPDVPPVVLTALEFARVSARLAEVRLSVLGLPAGVGRPFCIAEKTDDPLVVWVEVANAESRIETPTLEVSDAVVAGVSLGPAPGKPGAQRLAISLREQAGHAVVTEEGKVRVLVGNLPLAELRVVVDAGHGGHDTGAIGRSGLQEKEVNLDIARRVYRLLQGMGVEVRMTRVDDNPVRPWTRGNSEEQRQELMARCEMANQMQADLFVSVHANARQSNPTQYRGTETFYRKEDSAGFARAMQEEVVKALGLPDGGVKHHPKPIIVLYRTAMPSVLVEVGYLSHPEDEAGLATEELRERAAQGIVNGITRYVDEGGLLPMLAARERQRPSAQ